MRDDCQRDAVRFQFRVLVGMVGIEGFGQGRVELDEFTVELFNSALGVGPFDVADFRAIESGYAFLG